MAVSLLHALARYRQRKLRRFRRWNRKRRTWRMPRDYRNPMSGLLAILIALAIALLVLRYWPLLS